MVTKLIGTTICLTADLILEAAKKKIKKPLGYIEIESKLLARESLENNKQRSSIATM